MKIMILDGSPADGRGAAGRRLADAAERAAKGRGHEVARFRLDGLDIGPCRGCFACWLVHPGTCAFGDDQGPILAAMASSDIQIWTTPIAFGGYGPALKKALDRLIPNALPFFIKVHGEVHHPMRYDRRRSFLVLGTLPGPDPESERIFHHLVRRNTLNLGAVLTESRVLYENSGSDGTDELVGGLLAAAEEAI